MHQWNKSMTEMWIKSLNSMCSATGGAAWSPFMHLDKDPKTFSDNPWQMSLKMTETMFESFNRFWGSQQGMLGQSGTLSDLMLSLTQMGLEGYVDIQEEWLKTTAKGFGSTKPGEREDLIGLTSMWLEALQKLVRPFLNAPAVGLNRSYQEQLNQVVDKYYEFSTRMTELLRSLNVPLEDSSTAMRRQMEEWAKQGKPPANKESYEQWVSILESCYMELSKSPDYVEQLYKTLDAYSDYLMAQQQVYGNALRTMPIATTKDLDELAKEIYLLKKNIKELVKRMNTEAAPVSNDTGNSGNGNQEAM